MTDETWRPIAWAAGRLGVPEERVWELAFSGVIRGRAKRRDGSEPDGPEGVEAEVSESDVEALVLTARSAGAGLDEDKPNAASRRRRGR